MNIAIWMVIAIPIVCSAAPITQGVARKVDTKALQKLVNKTGLPLPAHLVEPVLTRIRIRERYAVIGGMTGVAIAVVAAVLARWTDTAGGAMVMVAAPLGTYVGIVIAVLVGKRSFDADAPRMARTREIVQSDYLHPLEIRARRWSPIVAVIVFGLAMAGLTLLPRQGDESDVWNGVAIGAVVLAIVSAVVVELMIRAAVARPQQAQGRLELAWDDVLRADAMRGLGVSVLILSGISVSISGFTLAATTVAPETRVGAMDLTLVLGGAAGLVVLAGLAAILMLALLAQLQAPGRRVRSQLWPGEDFTVEAQERTC